MVDNKSDEKELEELKNVYNQYLDKRKQIMIKTRFKADDIFGDVISKDSISPEQITKLNDFLAKLL